MGGVEIMIPNLPRQGGGGGAPSGGGGGSDGGTSFYKGGSDFSGGPDFSGSVADLASMPPELIAVALIGIVIYFLRVAR